MSMSLHCLHVCTSVLLSVFLCLHHCCVYTIVFTFPLCNTPQGLPEGNLNIDDAAQLSGSAREVKVCGTLLLYSLLLFLLVGQC